MFFTKRLNKLEIDVVSNRQMILAVNGMIKDIYDIFEKTGLHRENKKSNISFGPRYFDCNAVNSEFLALKKQIEELEKKILRSTKKPVAKKKT